MDNIDQIHKDFLSDIEGVTNLEELDNIRIKYLGKNGILTEIAKKISSIPPETRAEFGKNVNLIKKQINVIITEKKDIFEKIRLDEKLRIEKIDLGLPVYKSHKGSPHILSLAMHEITNIFANLGFDIKFGPDIDNDFNNFTALNFPLNHPARNLHDTFFLCDSDEKLLRTHTSTVQIRTMLKYKPPIAIVAPGRTFRCDSDQTHTPMFHQIEGLVVDKNIHMGHLKSVLHEFIDIYFEINNCKSRFRPHHFPFTEPSAEMDILYEVKNGKINFGQGDKWMEILGCGMVHPNVLRNCNIDPDVYSGFAFGMGLDRLCMLKYGINDLRSFFNNDANFLTHYSFDPVHYFSKANLK